MLANAYGGLDFPFVAITLERVDQMSIGESSDEWGLIIILSCPRGVQLAFLRCWQALSDRSLLGATLIGATNAFFRKSFERFPTVVQLPSADADAVLDEDLDAPPRIVLRDAADTVAVDSLKEGASQVF